MEDAAKPDLGENEAAQPKPELIEQSSVEENIEKLICDINNITTNDEHVPEIAEPSTNEKESEDVADPLLSATKPNNDIVLNHNTSVTEQQSEKTAHSTNEEGESTTQNSTQETGTCQLQLYAILLENNLNNLILSY